MSTLWFSNLEYDYEDDSLCCAEIREEAVGEAGHADQGAVHHHSDHTHQLQGVLESQSGLCHCTNYSRI